MKSKVSYLETSLTSAWEEIEILKQAQEEQDKKCMAMEEQLNEERGKRIRLDAYSRRENLNFKGIPEKEGESCENIIRDLLHELGFSNPQNIGFHAVHRLGKPRDGGKPRPIIARVISRQDRDLDFRKKRKLVGSTRYPGVYITDDFQREIQRERIILIKAMEKAKAMGKQAKCSGAHYMLTATHTRLRRYLRYTGKCKNRRKNIAHSCVIVASFPLIRTTNLIDSCLRPVMNT
ncbi:uncharacterized protein LOC125568075 [Nematostella vectensis]|uniref:uncharacterized protein LOC125568075 n=1 Tax=Nematostella vectensis TaxID=45351 RepID=UPI0020773741|nr:uncharacterized protein LOC125568075 [Nematostella vectensis]